jgi:hypothetical protein
MWDARLKVAFGVPNVVLHLKRQPEARPIAERPAEPQRNLRVDALAFLKDGSEERFIDPKQLGELGFARL